ncbi:MAG: hypothetical protein GPOALKHO_000822 [Sodalis sp.]|nr:MAG: hypothetical protein GPOALKHO_000822 [Sodalis sp.]
MSATGISSDKRLLVCAISPTVKDCLLYAARDGEATMAVSGNTALRPTASPAYVPPLPKSSTPPLIE